MVLYYGQLIEPKPIWGQDFLRSWICQPLKSVSDIMNRQDSVTELVEKK